MRFPNNSEGIMNCLKYLQFLYRETLPKTHIPNEDIHFASVALELLSHYFSMWSCTLCLALDSFKMETQVCLCLSSVRFPYSISMPLSFLFVHRLIFFFHPCCYIVTLLGLSCVSSFILLLIFIVMSFWTFSCFYFMHYS